MGDQKIHNFYIIEFIQCVNSLQNDLVERLFNAQTEVTKLGSRKVIFPKVTKMGSIFGHRIDYDGVGVLIG